MISIFSIHERTLHIEESRGACYNRRKRRGARYNIRQVLLETEAKVKIVTVLPQLLYKISGTCDIIWY